jgi:crotonobetainyl-CoA:carnitine CoA-transferase CaiB-like acyl-CoA transferase
MTERIDSPYGPGLVVDKDSRSMQVDSEQILRWLAKQTPGFRRDEAFLNQVTFTGNETPCIPGPIKSQALTSAIHAMAGLVAIEILEQRGITGQKVEISCDAAALYCATPIAWRLDDESSVSIMKTSGKLKTIAPLFDEALRDSALKFRATSIYPTSQSHVYYQLHGSTNAKAVLEALNIDVDSEEKILKSRDEAYNYISRIMMKYTASELDSLFTSKGLCGSTCFRPDQWLKTEMGQEMSRHPLVSCVKIEDCDPVPLSRLENAQEEVEDVRPLVGIKVVELARIIAAPALGQNLAALGAQVVKIQSKSMVDLSYLQFTLTAGKDTVDMDLNQDGDRDELIRLISDADVIIDGFRPGALARHGVGLDHALDVARQRNRGVIYVNESCFDTPPGSSHPWSKRPGWQQVADAAAGSSYVMGRAYNCEEEKCVLPSLPISDMSTGAVALVSTLIGLRDRCISGGSYLATASLTRYNMASLHEEVGLYSKRTVEEISRRFDFPPMTPDMHVNELFFLIHDKWMEHNGPMAYSSLWTHFEKSSFNASITIPKPVIAFEHSRCTPIWTSPPKSFASMPIKDYRW